MGDQMTDTIALTEYRHYIQQNYVAKDPDLFQWSSEYLVPGFRAALENGSPQFLRAVLRQEAGDVWVFDMLQQDFCDRLIAEVEWFGQWCEHRGVTKRAPNTMNNYGAVLDDFGFTSFLQEMMHRAVMPFSSLLYPDVGGDSLDNHHGFVVDYEIGKDEDLDFHVDQSDVTLNVCLGQQFEHGELYFAGIRCALHQQTVPRPEEEHLLRHSPGQGLLHRGKHRHAARKITSGRRMNLILWCMSSKNQQMSTNECTSWCGWERSTS